LSELLKIDKATTAKALKRLEEEGYVVRDIDSSDKRAYKVFVTQKALDIKPVLQDAIISWGNILSNELSQEEKDKVIDILKKMAENASKSVKICNKDNNHKTGLDL
jgi:DNA-binding MarR family transcriptional regulator